MFENLAMLTLRQTAREISEAEAMEEMKDMLERARLSMTDEQFTEIQRRALIEHHVLAKELTAVGYTIPGNDPHRPN